MIKFLKRLRDDTLLWRYVERVPSEIDRFLINQKHLKGKNLALVVAFEQPWITAIQLRQFRKNVPGVNLIVFDNSRSLGLRTAIEKICEDYEIPYFPLPVNRMRHPNRSHGMAMTWIYHNFVTHVHPNWFGYLDHDLVPVRLVNYGERLDRYACFGKRFSGRENYWYLWAGYSFFKYDFVRGMRLNFLNDFSRELDTGGRNWDMVFARTNETNVLSVTHEKVFVTAADVKNFPMLLIDSAWLHVSGVGHRSVDLRKDLYTAFQQAFDSGNIESEDFCLRKSDDSLLTSFSIAQKDEHIF